MPVDPIIIATTNSTFDDESIAKLNVDMFDQLGNFSGPSDSAIGKLEDDEYYQDYLPEGFKAELGLCCYTDTAYYGVGYERGSWPELVSIFEMMKRRVPKSTIWYGSDNDEQVCRIDSEWVNEMWAYWVVNGNRPYDSKFK